VCEKIDGLITRSRTYLKVRNDGNTEINVSLLTLRAICFWSVDFVASESDVEHVYPKLLDLISFPSSEGMDFVDTRKR
jgi:hypothetical protein